MIRQPGPTDDDLRAIVNRCEGDLSALVERDRAAVESARTAVRLQCELLEAELSDPSDDGERDSWLRSDAATTLERFEAARSRHQRSSALLGRLHAAIAADDSGPHAARVAELERALAERRAAEHDLRSLVAAQRADLTAALADLAACGDHEAVARHSRFAVGDVALTGV